jgi:hypothetical protein
VLDIREFGYGSNHHKTTALLQTTLKDLLTEVTLNYNQTSKLFVNIDYWRQLSCTKDLIFYHGTKKCKRGEKTKLIVNSTNQHQ